MSQALEDLKVAVTDLTAEVQAGVTQIQKLKAELVAATAGDDSVIVELTAQIDALTASLAAANPTETPAA